MKNKLLGFIGLMVLFLVIATIQTAQTAQATQIDIGMPANATMDQQRTENIAANKSVAIDNIGGALIPTAIKAQNLGDIQTNVQNGFAIKSGYLLNNDMKSTPAGNSQNDSWMIMCKADNPVNMVIMLKCPMYTEEEITIGMNVIVDTAAPVWSNKDSPGLCRNSLIAT